KLQEYLGLINGARAAFQAETISAANRIATHYDKEGKLSSATQNQILKLDRTDGSSQVPVFQSMNEYQKLKGDAEAARHDMKAAVNAYRAAQAESQIAAAGTEKKEQEAKKKEIEGKAAERGENVKKWIDGAGEVVDLAKAAAAGPAGFITALGGKALELIP